MPMTEKEFTAATFIAVAALAKKLTGADVVVTMICADGCVRSISAGEGHVTWLEDGAANSVVCSEVIEAARQTPPSVVQLAVDAA